MRKTLFEQLIKNFYKDAWGSQIQFNADDEDEQEPEDIPEEDIEEFKTSRDGVETTVKVYFSKTGFPIATETIFTKVIDLKDHNLNTLKEQLKKAVADEDYAKAAELKTKIDELQK